MCTLVGGQRRQLGAGSRGACADLTLDVAQSEGPLGPPGSQSTKEVTKDLCRDVHRTAPAGPAAVVEEGGAEGDAPKGQKDKEVCNWQREASGGYQRPQQPDREVLETRKGPSALAPDAKPGDVIEGMPTEEREVDRHRPRLHL